jgi:Rha family phage regulatory protein
LSRIAATWPIRPAHAHVLRDIREIIENTSKTDASNFGAVTYRGNNGEDRPAFTMTRDGFSLLAMGFTGTKALHWKLRYIEAFNMMEAAIKSRASGRIEGAGELGANVNARQRSRMLAM